MHLYPERPSGVSRFSQFSLGIGIGRVDQKSNRGGSRDHFAQQLDPFRGQVERNHRNSGQIAAWPVQAGDEARGDRIAAHDKHDRNGRGRRLGSQRRGGPAGRNQDGHPPAHEFGRKLRKSIIATFCSAKFDRHVLPFDESNLDETLAQRRHEGCHRTEGREAKDPTVGIVGCCARAASGNAAAPPSNVRKFRRFS